MKKKLARILASAMAVFVSVASSQVQTLHADEYEHTESADLADETALYDGAGLEGAAEYEAVPEETAEYEVVPEETAEYEAAPEEIPEYVVAPEEMPEYEAASEEAASYEAAPEETPSDVEVNTEEIQYIYIESPVLNTPDTQRVVFSLGSAYADEGEFTITVQDSWGQSEEWGLANRADHLLLFEKQYVDESQTGTYQVVSLNVGSADNRRVLPVSEWNMDARFGVNQQYEGVEDLVRVDEVSAEETAGVTVVSLDGLNEAEAEKKIENALGAAEAASNEPVVDSETGEIIETVRNYLSNGNRKSGTVVIALDPGHDANDAGASYGGLREEVLTLKIANYCREELEKYEGVKIYMTRTTAACPYNCKSAGSCLEQRAAAAARAGADFYISFHLNASASGAARGAEIIVPNYSWKPEVAYQGRALAEKILNELVALGLKNRGMYSKNTTVGELYPDGSISDYFTAHCCNKENGIPALIVEHAFLTNSGDVNAFLSSEEGLKKLGVADAHGIVKYFGLTQGRWERTSEGTFYYSNGSKVYGEQCINGEWYHFDANTGAMKTGWYNFPNKTVYYRSNGQMIHGEGNIDGKWYYFDKVTGGMVTGWVQLPNKIVYYNRQGHMIYGEQTLDGKQYYFDPVTGARKAGWHQFPHKRVYYGSDGEMKYGEQCIGGKWYYFDTVTGAMKTGWHSFPHKTVYYAPTGEMRYGEQCIGGKWYYFDTVTGAMKTGWHSFPHKTVFYGSHGEMKYGEQCIGGKWYYLDPQTGAMKTGWHSFPHKTVYYAPTGEMRYGEQCIGGKWYYFDTVTGAMKTGWHSFPHKTVFYAPTGEMKYGKQTIGGKQYYFDTVTGAMKKGEQCIGGKWYYFDTATGAMKTGWHSFPHKKVYYASTGEMLYGNQTIDGNGYYFDTVTGALQ